MRTRDRAHIQTHTETLTINDIQGAAERIQVHRSIYMEDEVHQKSKELSRYYFTAVSASRHDTIVIRLLTSSRRVNHC